MLASPPVYNTNFVSLIFLKGEPGVQRATLQAGRRQLPVMAPAGAMLMMRRDVLLEVGGYPSDSEQQTDWQLLCSLSVCSRSLSCLFFRTLTFVLHAIRRKATGALR